MALRVSPEGVRDVRFSEQWRGYRTDEVDEFVEQVAEAFDELEGRLEEAVQRTALAERRLDERGPDDDLRRTLVLAQRTADAALEEARVEAARMVADAEEQARSILDHLEERKVRIEGEIEAQISVELGQLDDRKAALEADVDLLTAFVEDHRGRLVQELRTHLGWLERTGPLEPLPVSLARSVPRLLEPDPTHESDGEVAPVVAAVVAHSDVDETVVAQVPGPSSVDAMSTDEAGGGASDDIVANDSPTDDSLQDDDAALDALDVIPRGGASEDNPVPVASVPPDVDRDDTDDDPFIAELRRAVDDPEPLGPREENAEWSDDVDLYERHKAGPTRSRRRRRH